MRTGLFIGLFALLLLGQADAMATCSMSVKAEDNGLFGKGGNPPGPAVLFSAPVTVPAFRLRFVDFASGSQVLPTKVSLAYGWRWLEYPYPEHAWGAWSEANDLVECQPLSSEVEIPKFEVRPRGWYDGKYSRFPFSKKPSFSGVGIVVQTNGCTTRATISVREAARVGGRVLVFKANCKGESTISFQTP